MIYNPEYLNNINILSKEQNAILEELSSKFKLTNLLNNAKLINKLEFDFIYSSAKIEGNTYTKADTLALLEDGITANGKKYTDAKMIMNLRKGFNEVLDKELPISKETLHNLHSILSDELVLNANKGNMRNIQIDAISGTDYKPLPPGERLKTEMDFLFSQYHKIQNPFERAFYLHNNLCYLQYFEDCNKRTARIMQFLSMKNDDIVPVFILGDNKEVYSNYRMAIVDYYDTGRYNTYFDFFVKNYEKAMEFLSFDYKNADKEEKSIHRHR
ncbi:cell division protein [Campylobacter fetus subsp. venerealis cfvi97/532]|nr:cell division protein [Campylobacter fetus subsp. venerealis cfvi97/532]